MSLGYLMPRSGRGMTAQKTTKGILAAHDARVLLHYRPRESEGAGKAGCTIAPAASCASRKAKRAHERIQVRRNMPAFPAQCFTAYSALSPVSGLDSHRHP